LRANGENRARRAWTAAAALVPALVLFGLAEGALRLWGPAAYRASAGRDVPVRPAHEPRVVRVDGSIPAEGERVPAEELLYVYEAERMRGLTAPVVKGDEIRIGVFGGSSVYGWPCGSAESFPAVAETILWRTLPGGTDVRVLNAGVLGEWSGEVRARVAGLLEADLDWVVLYMGHNDYSFLRELMQTRPWVRRVQRVLHRSVAYQVLASYLVEARTAYLMWKDSPGLRFTQVGALREELRRRNVLMDWREWDAVAPELDGASGRFADFRRSVAWIDGLFESNLEAIVRSAQAAGARVVLMTVASNVRDSGPWWSDHMPALSDADLLEWERRIGEARTAADGDELDKAIVLYRAALDISPRSARTHYELGRTLERAGEAGAALEHFLLARDFDLSGDRAPGVLNDTVREVAERTGAMLIDVERDFLTCYECRGKVYFYDELHPSCLGYRRIGEQLAARLREVIAPELARAGAAP